MSAIGEREKACEDRHYGHRWPLAGKCIDIDGNTWHKDGENCEFCGFGIDDYSDGRGFWNEPLTKERD